MNTLIKDLQRYLVIALSSLVLLMILNTITHYSFIGFTGLWYELDVRIEGSLATWVESAMMLACAIPAYASYLLAKELPVKKSFRLFLLLWVLTALYISADEMLGLHEYISEIIMKTELVNRDSFLYGFNWVFLYAPAAFLIMAFSLYEIKYFLHFTQSSHKALWISILIMSVGIVLVIILEILEAWLYSVNLSRQISTLFEETAEFFIIFGFYRLMQSIFTLLEQECTS